MVNMNRKFILFFLSITFIASVINLERSDVPPKYKKWIEEEVIYIITPAEKEVFHKLETDKERDQFMEEFWRQRDPTPGTPRNEFKEEHYRRIAYANKKFGRGTPIQGWRTDRGRIYIKLGNPGLIQKFIDYCIYPVEIWYYQGNPRYGQTPLFRLLFFQRHGVGEFELYNPISDGPRSLVTLIMLGSFEEQDRAAYGLIKKVSLELADTSLSSFPGQGRWEHLLPSTILLGGVEVYPQKKVQDDYAYGFLEHKATVEVSYSVYYMGNQSRVNVIQDTSGIFFVNYSIEPETLSVDSYQDRYFTNLKVSMRVTDTEGKNIFQQERNFPIELKKEQLKKIGKRPFHLCDSFPLIPGEYTFNLLMENTVTKEFTSFEKDISVPEPESFQMSSLILANKVNRDSLFSQFNKAFQVGNLQIYPSLGNVFCRKDKMFLFFQLYGLGQELEENAFLEYTFYRGEEEFQTTHKRVKEYENARDFLQEFSMEKFSSGRYEVKVSLLDMEGEEILSEREEFSVSEQPLPESWILSQTYPAINDPSYSTLLGIQFLNKGETTRAREELERAYSSDTDSLTYALNYARSLLALGEYNRIKDILIPFLDKPNKKYILLKFLGIAHQGLEEYEKAISYYKEYISLEGANFEVLNSIALCHYQSGNEREALRAWEKSLEINPDQAGIKQVINILKEKIRDKR
jgi:GWxTD domain-containing protein